jgi:predicted RNA-binding protein YlxR (DUF448 family)
VSEKEECIDTSLKCSHRSLWLCGDIKSHDQGVERERENRSKITLILPQQRLECWVDKISAALWMRVHGTVGGVAIIANCAHP